MPYKVIVAHPGKQHSFRAASALNDNGMLCKYVTTVYDSSNSRLMRFLKSVLPADDIERASGRRMENVSDDKVVQFSEFAGLNEIALYRLDKSKKVYRWWHDHLADSFGKKVAELAIKEQADAVIMYDTSSKSCFETLQAKAQNILRIMDVSLANRLYMKTVYQKDEELFPQYADLKRKEWGHLYNSRYCERLSQELKATQIFLAPSNFVKRSLEFSGISPEQIYVCPYGTNYTAHITEHPAFAERRPIKALFVGNATDRKGIDYLLRACKPITDKVQLTLVGGYDNSSHRFDEYLDCFDFVGKVTHSKVLGYLENSDVFVLPSLGEGFSLSILEAMSCGLPCIVSENSGAGDAIKDGVSGFVIPIQSADAIREKLLWCWEHQDKLPEMGKAACTTALEYTWDKYEDRLVKIINECLSRRSPQCTD